MKLEYIGRGRVERSNYEIETSETLPFKAMTKIVEFYNSRLKGWQR